MGTNSLLNLNQGAFSDANEMTGNIAIAYGAEIENGVTGAGADTLIGNSGDNELRGGVDDDIYVLEGDVWGDDLILDGDAFGSSVAFENTSYTIDAYSVFGQGYDLVIEVAGNALTILDYVIGSYDWNFSINGAAVDMTPVSAPTPTEFADDLTGADGDDTIDGLGGDDTITGVRRRFRRR